MNIEKICKEGIREWEQTKQYEHMDTFIVSEEQKNKNEEQLDALMNMMKPYMDAFPKQKKLQKQWRKKGEEFLKDWASKDEIFRMADMRPEDSECFYEVSKQFIRDARNFDASLALEDIGQALRNIWIIVILQQIFGKEVKYHKAMFAYSMLYPYSDNYLDDANIDKEIKKQFNHWFTKRLQGEDVRIHNSHEEKIAKLVSLIEEEFERSKFPEVYTSLMMIQDAQIQSLDQQDGDVKMRKEQVSNISYRKGGTSVVADGFLIEGKMNEQQVGFCMRYGFMLQIGDDLQDAKDDVLHHHQTLASNYLTQPLDQLLFRLVQYTHDILQPQQICQDQRLLDFVIHDCVLLLCIAVAQNKEYYSEECYKAMRACLPISLEKLEILQKNNSFSMCQEDIRMRIDVLIDA